MPEQQVEKVPNAIALAVHSDSASSDSLLLELIQEGDESAMGRLYDTHSRIVYSVGLRVLRDPAAAEDVLQDVFLRIWREPTSFIAARGSLGAWLSIIARNRAIDVLRKRRPADPIDDIPLRAPGDLASDVERSLMMEQIRPLIAKLPEAQREALELAFFRGWTHAEIARTTQIPLGTIKTRIRSALKSLGSAVTPRLPLTQPS